MSFDGSGYGTDLAAQVHTLVGREAAGLVEKAFYSGGLNHVSGRALTFAHVPAADILKALPMQPITLTRRSIEEASVVWSEYQRRFRAGGLRAYLQRQFYKDVQKGCRWYQQYARRSLHESSHNRVEQELLTYALHHLVPISLSVSKELRNLVFIPHHLHTKVHVAINRATNHLREGISDMVSTPMSQGSFPVQPKAQTPRKTHREAAAIV